MSKAPTNSQNLNAALLKYEDLSISFGSGRREKFAVKNLDLEIGIGERVA